MILGRFNCGRYSVDADSVIFFQNSFPKCVMRESKTIRSNWKNIFSIVNKSFGIKNTSFLCSIIGKIWGKGKEGKERRMRMDRRDLLLKYLRQERQIIHETSADYEHKNPRKGFEQQHEEASISADMLLEMIAELDAAD